MALTRLKNIITSRTGRIIYVNPDDFDASDAYDNRGNSALRPFKTLQRAFLEVSRFSYRVGLSNDEFDAFSIYLYPSEYVFWVLGNMDNEEFSDICQVMGLNCMCACFCWSAGFVFVCKSKLCFLSIESRIGLSKLFVKFDLFSIPPGLFCLKLSILESKSFLKTLFI